MPLAKSAIFFSTGMYRDVGGRWNSGALAKKLVATVPVMVVTTLTPRGVISRRRDSLRDVRAALDAA